MRILIPIVRTVDAISEFFGKLTIYIVITAVIIGFYNVVARYIGRFIGMHLSSNLFIELQWYLYSLVFFFGFAYIMKEGINVRVDFIYTHWKDARKAALDFWGHLLFLIPFCLLGIYVTISPVLTSWGLLPDGSWGVWQKSPDPGGLPRAPLKTMIIVAFVLLLIQSLAELIKLWARMRGQAELFSIQVQDEESPLRIE